MDWARILAYITGTVDQELLIRNEYLAAENRILKVQLKMPLRLTDAERMTLAESAHRLGRKALDDVANTAKSDTIMGWYRRLIARKFDGSKSRRYPGRPRIDAEIVGEKVPEGLFIDQLLSHQYNYLIYYINSI